MYLRRLLSLVVLLSSILSHIIGTSYKHRHKWKHSIKDCATPVVQRLRTFFINSLLTFKMYH